MVTGFRLFIDGGEGEESIAVVKQKIGCLIDIIKYNTVSIETEMEQLCISASFSAPERL